MIRCEKRKTQNLLYKIKGAYISVQQNKVFNALISWKSQLRAIF